MLEPKELEKYIDEDINPGDYIVRELGGEYYVGQVIELSPELLQIQSLKCFPSG
jgi:hypothetical protein